MTPSADAEHPLRAHAFRVEIDGIASTGFSEVSGLGLSVDVVEYRSADDPGAIRQLPGQVRHLPLVLRRGVDENLELWAWIKAVRDGSLERRNGSVILLNARREDVMRVNFVRAWPSAWRLSDLDAASSEIVVEELVLQHEGLSVAD